MQRPPGDASGSWSDATCPTLDISPFARSRSRAPAPRSPRWNQAVVAPARTMSADEAGKSASTGRARMAPRRAFGRRHGCCRKYRATSGSAAMYSSGKKNAAIFGALVARYRRGRLAKVRKTIRIHLERTFVDLPGAAEDQPVDALRMPRRQHLGDQAAERGPHHMDTVEAAPRSRPPHRRRDPPVE